jgi:hypothetical protein
MPPIGNGEFICIELITRPLCSVAAVVDRTRHHYLGLRVMLAAAYTATPSAPDAHRRCWTPGSAWVWLGVIDAAAAVSAVSDAELSTKWVAQDGGPHPSDCHRL